MRFGDEPVSKCNLSSLRVLGSVGEPINSEAWYWYNKVVGGSRCPIVDTWWQTETGGHMITPLPGATPLKPGSATLPMFGVVPIVLDAEGREITEVECSGYLAIKRSWPGQMRTIFGDHDRFENTYFTLYDAENKLICDKYYITGDGCRRDKDGYYWLTGRVDDVINVSGHRIGTAEVESKLDEHPMCAEAAVVGYPHSVKGEAIYAFVILNQGVEPSEQLRTELKNIVRKDIGAFAQPDIIHWAPGLPKTRSGKIMRRILRKIAAGQTSTDDLGDISTLADPSVVEELVANKQHAK
jgi:acetyl-CoA synthetase